eukprot:500118_1
MPSIATLFSQTTSGLRKTVMAAKHNEYCCRYCLAYETGGKSGSILMILALSVSLMGLIVTLFISYHSAIEMPKLKRLDSTIKLVYIASIITAYIIFILCIIQAIVCLLPYSYRPNFPSLVLHGVHMTFYCLLILCLLAMLIIRLHFTFRTSHYRLSKLNIYILFIAYILVVIGSIVHVTEYMIALFSYRKHWNPNETEIITTGWIGPIAIILYIITSVYAIYLFTNKLIILAKQQVNTNESGMHRLFYSASKYAKILSVAICVTALSSIVWFIHVSVWKINYHKGVYGYWGAENALMTQITVFILSIDCVVNISCLYLQFKFASKYYDMLCKTTLDYICCCRYVFHSNSQKPIKFQNIGTMDSEQESVNEGSKEINCSNN